MDYRNINNEEDQALQNLFQSYEKEKAPDSFTKNTMNKVLHEWQTQPISATPEISAIQKTMIAIAIVFCIALVYFVDIKNPHSGLSFMNNFKNNFLSIMSESLFLPLQAIIKKIPVFVYIITFSSAFILMIDKLTHRISSNYRVK